MPGLVFFLRQADSCPIVAKVGRFVGVHSARASNPAPAAYCCAWQDRFMIYIMALRHFGCYNDDQYKRHGINWKPASPLTRAGKQPDDPRAYVISREVGAVGSY